MKRALFSLARVLAMLLMKTPLRRFPGTRAAYELVYRLLVPGGTAIVEAQGSKILVNRLDIGVALYLLTEGIYEPRLTEIFTQRLAPGMVVVDAGANIGYFSLLAARLVGDGGRVYAFEPEPTNFAMLTKNIELNGYANVVATPAALSDRHGPATLFLDGVNLGNPSLAESNVSAAAQGIVDVETVPLDDFLARQEPLPQVDLIKLDTQGAEGLVLRGAEKTLANPALTIVMEFWPWGLQNLGSDPTALLESLRGRGFGVSLLDDAKGLAADVADDFILDECRRRESGKGFVTLILQR